MIIQYGMELYNDPLFQKTRETLKGLQKSEEGFYGWSATINRSTSLQNLLRGRAGEVLENYQEREVEEKTVSIQVYVRHGDPQVMGQAGLTMDPFGDLESQVRNALRSAFMVENQVWDLPTPPDGPYPEVNSCDLSMIENPTAVRQNFLESLSRAASSLEGVHLNSAEFYINLNWIHTEFSTGIVMPEARTDFYFEAAMEKLPLPNTQEVHRYRKGVSINELDVAQFLGEMREEALSLGNTDLPETTENATLLVDGEVVSDFINALVGQLNGASEYNRSPVILPGSPVEEGSVGDSFERLNLRLDPLIPGMVESRPFNHEGLVAKAADVVKDGVVQEQILSHRMASYLGKPVNPIVGNFLIPPGKKTRSELISDAGECIEILSFSSLLINPRTLTWSSEIKLARHHMKDGSVRLLKGGVASGSIRAHLSAARFSSEILTRNAVADTWHPSIGYRGPAHMLIQAGVKIAGK